MRCFNSSHHFYLQILDQSIRYLVIHPTDKSIINQDEIIFETSILEGREVVNLSILVTRLDALVKEKNEKTANHKSYYLITLSY